MRTVLKRLGPLVVPVLLATDLVAQQTEGTGPERRAVAAAIGELAPPLLDGVLDDDAWLSAAIIDGFVQREPVEGRPVSERTEVRILYDDEALYVGAWNFLSDPSTIVFGETRRDASVDNTDAFLLILDTYLDRQNGFVFGTTPAGIEYDGQVTNEGQGAGGGAQRQQRGSGGGFNLNWDGSWEVATSIDDDGWYAEIRIPFSTLRYPSGGPQRWGVNFARNIRDRNEQSVWTPIPRQFNLYRVSLAGELTGFEAPSKRVFTITPYVLGDVSREYSIPGSSTEWDGAIGGDVKIGLNQSLTLDLTVNTDFAQVEVDDVQVNLTRFPLFFPEKRPFFLENAGTFAVGSPQAAELFFSRRIGLSEGAEVPILGGARLTGKVGGMQVGFLNVQTRDLSLFDEELGEDAEVEPNTNFGVVRLFQEFDNRTRVGGLFVSRINTDNSDDYNLTYGVDGRLGIGEALTLDAWVAGTQTPDVGGDEYGLNFGSRYETRDWRITAGYREISDEFNPEVGFLPRSEYRHANARVLRAIRFPEVSWFRELRPHVSWSQFWDFTGFSESYIFHMDSHFEFESGQFFQFPGLNFTGEGLQEPFEIREGIIIPAGSYNNIDWEFRSRTNLAAPLSLRLNIDAGGFYNGTRFGTNSTLAYRFEDKFVTSLRLSWFDVNLEQGDFVTSVLALKGSYSFTPRIFLQGTLQYNNETENFGSNVRFGWLDTAGTGLYVVFNDLEHFGSLDRTGIERGPQRRQLIIKYTKQFNIGG
ncbi:MAG: carbohydrate binding family 9 domain-containing protein [Gemmatimonadota bacterium]|nr:carbohydrate binding family 9 domain-containing protein [Gemmatimonadota bacterium]